MVIAEGTRLIEKFEIYMQLCKERQRLSSAQRKHKKRVHHLTKIGRLLPNWTPWHRNDIDYHQVQILDGPPFTNSPYTIDIETICKFALLVNIDDACTEIETKIGELLNETIEEERGKIVYFDVPPNRSQWLKDARVFFQAFSMEYCGNDSEQEKYYVLLNKENFGNKNFNLIYENKSKIFQFLEFNRITVGEEYNVSDDYIEKKFSQWEKDKKMRLDARDAALHRYETVEEWDANNEELPIQEQVKEEDSKNLENYNCLVIDTVLKGWTYTGWIEQFPLEKITITWSERDDIDKYYLLDENEIIRVGQLLDIATENRTEEEVQNLGIYRQYRYDAKSWSNDNFIKQEEKIFPIYSDGYRFRFKEGEDIAIVANVSEQLLKKKAAKLVELCEAEGLPTDGKKPELIARLVEAKERKEDDDNWYWEIERVPLNHWFAHLEKEKGEWVRAHREQIKRVRRGEIRGTFRESHGYFLDKAKVNKFDIIYKKDVFSLEELYTTKMIKRLIRTVYRILTEKLRHGHQTGPWTFICDEKYLYEKAHGKNAIVIMYSIIPPGAASDCPPTSAFYHGMEAALHERETKLLQDSISKNENIENYSFIIDEDYQRSDSSKSVARGISITFPIIVQIIKNKLKSKSRETPLKVSFINERIDAGDYGIGTNIVLETSDRLELVMEFEKVAPFKSLPKAPNSHPFLQYPDLIGRKYDSGYNVSIDKYNASIKEFEAPMGTFEEIRDIILTDSITPIDFFKKLMDSKNIELAKFCGAIPYSMGHYNEILKGKIHDNLNILYDNKDLKTLFKEIQERSEKENSREIIRQILKELFKLLEEKEQIADDNLLPKYELSSKDEFEWLMQRLSFETHLDNFEMIEKVKDELNKRKSEGNLGDIYGNRLITMENLFISSDQNSFVFDNFEKSKILEIINEENSMMEQDNQVGAMCLSLLLKNKNSNSEDFDLAEMGEDYLLKREGETSRRVTNMIEINIIRNLIENDSGDELIGFRTLQEIKNNNDKYSSYYSNSPYFMAAVLKTIALTNFSQLEDNQDLRKFAKMILDGRCFIGEHIHYPNNRVAYWFIRAYFNLNGTSIDKIDSRVNKCSRQLFNYKNSDFNYNTVGLMTMCQLLDLYYRFGFNEEKSLFEFEQTDEGSLWEDYKEKLNSVKTAFSTKKWFEENAPDKDDRLRPLNFTYR